MKLLFFSLAILISANGFATPMVLNCEITNSDFRHEDIRIQSVEKDGLITFNGKIDRLYTYFFPYKNISQSAKFHTDSRFEFDASIIENKLILKTRFYNYLRTDIDQDGNKIPVTLVSNVVKAIDIDWPRINYGNEQFIYPSDGQVNKELFYLNQDDWIGELNWKLYKCSLSNL